MPVNDSNMLSKLSLGMAQLDELLEAEQIELDNLSSRILSVMEQFAVRTATYTISRYEKIFDISGAGKTLEERRAAIIVYMNARPPVTKSYLEQLLTAATGCRCTIDEYKSEGHFVVNIDCKTFSPNISIAASYVKLLKPAHLEAILRRRLSSSAGLNAVVRPKIGRVIRVRPYQPETIQATVAVGASLHIKGARRLHVHPKGV